MLESRKSTDYLRSPKILQFHSRSKSVTFNLVEERHHKEKEISGSSTEC